MMLSKEDTPVLAGTIPAFEIFLTKMEKLAETKSHLKPYIDKGLSFAYDYYKRMDGTIAMILAMRTFFFFVTYNDLVLTTKNYLDNWKSLILQSAFIGLTTIGKRII